MTFKLGENRSVLMIVNDKQIDRRVLAHSQTLSDNGFTVTVICDEAPENAQQKSERSYPDIKVVRTTPQHGAPLDPEVDIEKIGEIARQLPQFAWAKLFPGFTELLVEACKHKVDIIVANDLPQLAIGIIAARLHGAKLLYDAHELYPEQEFPEQTKELFTDMERQLIHCADAVSVVNESIGQLMFERYPCKKPVVLLNSVSMRGRKKLAGDKHLHKRLHIPSEKKILLYQGNLALEARNLECLVEAIALLSRDDIALVLMGADPSGQARPGLSAIAEKDGTLDKTVFFSDEIPQEELIDVTASASAGIIPYTATSLNNLYCTPNKLFEFIAAGVPILANPLPELQKFIAGNGFGLNTSMRTSKEMAAAIENLFSSQYETFRSNLRKKQASFLWEAQEETILQIHSELLKDHTEKNLANARSLHTAICNILRENPVAAKEALTKVLGSLESDLMKQGVHNSQ